MSRKELLEGELFYAALVNQNNESPWCLESSSTEFLEILEKRLVTKGMLETLGYINIFHY